MKEYEIRRSIVIRRLSYVSLFKIFFLGGAGIMVPFCALGLLFAVFFPGNVHLQEGQTMLQFVLMLLVVAVAWPFFFALFFGTAAWIAFGAKSLLAPTSIEVLRDEHDLPGEAPIQSPDPTRSARGSS